MPMLAINYETPLTCGYDFIHSWDDGPEYPDYSDEEEKVATEPLVRPTEIDLARVVLEEEKVNGGPGYEDGDRQLKYLKQHENIVLKRASTVDGIPLDAFVLQTLWDQKAFPEEWKARAEDGSIVGIVFHGATMQDSQGNPLYIFVFWKDEGWQLSQYYWDGT